MFITTSDEISEPIVITNNRVREQNIIDLKHNAIQAGDDILATMCELALGGLPEWWEEVEVYFSDRAAMAQAYEQSKLDQLVSDFEQGKWEAYAKF